MCGVFREAFHSGKRSVRKEGRGGRSVGRSPKRKILHANDVRVESENSGNVIKG